MKLYGRIKSFSERGYGFIVSQSIERDVFFHASDWRAVEIPIPGEEVEFEVIPARFAGKPNQASNVHPLAPSGVAIPICAGVEALSRLSNSEAEIEVTDGVQ